jgi:hypothetical protein
MSHDRQWGWILLVLAVVWLLTGIAGYYQFDDTERTGKSIRTSRWVAEVYEEFGKEGFLVLLGGASVICCGVGIWLLVKSSGDPRGPEDGREGGPGSGIGQPVHAAPGSARCPKCGGDIRPGASFCKHCREWLA